MIICRSTVCELYAKPWPIQLLLVYNLPKIFVLNTVHLLYIVFTKSGESARVVRKQVHNKGRTRHG